MKGVVKYGLLLVNQCLAISPRWPERDKLRKTRSPVGLARVGGFLHWTVKKSRPSHGPNINRETN